MSGAGKAWCFTLNNYNQDDIIKFRELSGCVYKVFQEEVGENGTHHLQGYLYFQKKARLSAVKKIDGRAHWELSKGNAQQNTDYCTKDETRKAGTEPFVEGIMPQQGKRTDLEGVYRDIENGATVNDIIDNAPEVYIKYHSGIEKVIAAKQPARDFKTEIFWYYGATGTGKSRKAHHEAGPDAYSKMGNNKWWDGYCGHDVVIIDDYRKDLCPFHVLLKLFDRYPMRVEVKGASVQFAPRRIYVTTPLSPRETWRCEDGSEREDIGQLIRRIEHVEQFTGLWIPDGTEPTGVGPMDDGTRMGHNRVVGETGRDYAVGFNPVVGAEREQQRNVRQRVAGMAADGGSVGEREDVESDIGGNDGIHEFDLNFSLFDEE